MPLSNKCVIEREKALDILEEIRANLPSELKMANEIVEKRNDFISAGKKEYDTKIKQAEEMAKQKVNDHELLIEARKRANEIIASAEQKAKQIMEAATTYCDNAMKDTEASIGKTLEQVKDTRVAFMTAMKDQK